MPTGRNDPCPCGSGKKYKICCLTRDGRDERSVLPASDAPARSSHLGWESDLAAIPPRLTDDPNDRPTFFLIAAGESPLYSELVVHPPSEPDEVAEFFRARLASAAEEHGGWPPSVAVRYGDLAVALGELLRDEKVVVLVEPVLAGLDPLLLRARERLGAPRVRYLPSVPQTWAAWGLPFELVARCLPRRQSTTGRLQGACWATA